MPNLFIQTLDLGTIQQAESTKNPTWLKRGKNPAWSLGQVLLTGRWQKIVYGGESFGEGQGEGKLTFRHVDFNVAVV